MRPASCSAPNTEKSNPASRALSSLPEPKLVLAMTVLAYNLYCLLALDLPLGFQRLTAQSIFEQLLSTGDDIRIEPDLCTVCLKKKRGLPALFEMLQAAEPTRIPWIGNRQLAFFGATRA